MMDKKKNILGRIIAIFVVAGFVVSGFFLEAKPTEAEDIKNTAYIEAQVQHVVDGDTIWVTTAERPEKFKVRYLGINAPESVHRDPSKNTEEGKIASEENAKLIESYNNVVYLEYDVASTDEFGRDLCYVYVKTTKGKYKMVQDSLLKKGLCRTVRIEPNMKYYKHFRKLEKKAKKNKVGFWGSEFN